MLDVAEAAPITASVRHQKEFVHSVNVTSLVSLLLPGVQKAKK